MMKILYGIQGTGNGHLSRAMEVVPHLQKMGDTDILISGIQGDLTLPFPIKYQFYGLGFMNHPIEHFPFVASPLNVLC